MTATGSTLRDGLSEPLAELGVDVEEVEIQQAGRRQVVRVVIDRDGGVDLDLVAEVSRRVGELLEEGPLSTAVPGPYVLEVTSPGVDRPLTEARHWRRALDRLVRVQMQDGGVIEGRICGVSDDDSVTLTVADADVTLDRADVVRAVVQVEFQKRDQED